MNWEVVKEVGQAISAWVPALLLAGGGLGFLFFRKYRLQQIALEQQHLALESQQHRSGLALNVKVTPRVFESGGEWFLETSIEVGNTSTKTWCIPAVYVSGRALVDRQGTEAYQGQTDFDDLPECPPLSMPLNRAYLRNSVIQLAPGETELFVRWDKLDKQFVGRYPVVVIAAEVFGASEELLGERHLPRQANATNPRLWLSAKKQGMDERPPTSVVRGKSRRRWLEYLAERAKRGDLSVLFARWRTLGHEPGDPFEAGQRYIQVSEDGKLVPDRAASGEFREVLDTVVQWSRQTTVDVMGAAQKSSAKS